MAMQRVVACVGGIYRAVSTAVCDVRKHSASAIVTSGVIVMAKYKTRMADC